MPRRGHGMRKETFNHIRDNIHLLKIDYENGKILNRKESLNGHGYWGISLRDKYVLVHQIIAFVKYKERCVNLTVNHENKVKTDNRPDNLTLMTSAENTRHGNAKITDGQAWQVKHLFWRGLTQQMISEILNIPRTTVATITSGQQNWKHIEHDNLGIKRMKLKDQGLMAAKQT